MRPSASLSFLVAALAATLSGQQPAASKPAGIQWEPDLATALARGAEDGRPVIAFFTFDTCHWCHVLEEKTFPDPAVVAKSASFHWVTVNRDRTPALAREFNVSAYPALPVLGRERENVHRFDGFKEPALFLEQLETGLKRFAVYREGKTWDAPASRPAQVCEGTVATWPAPCQELPSGLVELGGQVWVAQRRQLFALDPTTGAVKSRFTLPFDLQDLCTDGEWLYGVEYGWTSGAPIHQLSPKTGAVERDITTEANKANKHSSGAGIAWRDGRLWVAEISGKLHCVDPATGAVESVLQTQAKQASGLVFHGGQFVLAGREGIRFVDPTTGKVTRTIATHYPIRALGFFGEQLLLMEQPVSGFGRKHETIRVWPREYVIHRVTLPK